MPDMVPSLVWVTHRFAVNPQEIVSVFHGKSGEVIVTLTAGDQLHAMESDLTRLGRELLLPPQRRSEHVPPAAVAPERSAAALRS